jgi:hypothetical protein
MGNKATSYMPIVDEVHESETNQPSIVVDINIPHINRIIKELDPKLDLFYSTIITVICVYYKSNATTKLYKYLENISPQLKSPLFMGNISKCVINLYDHMVEHKHKNNNHDIKNCQAVEYLVGDLYRYLGPEPVAESSL